MNESSAKYMMAFLIGTSVLNFLIALMVRIKTKHKEFTPLLIYWPCIVVTFIAAAVLSATPTQIAFAYFFQIFSSNLIVVMMCTSQGIKINWKLYISIQLASMFLTTYLILYTHAGFTLSVLPTAIAFSLPFIKPIRYALIENKENANWIEKFMALVFITGMINHLNYPLFRLDSSIAIWGWSISIAQYQCLSLFLPLLINYRREENEKKHLLQAIEKISGNNFASIPTDELYGQLEFQIAEKERYAQKLQTSNSSLEEEREMNEILIRTISHDLANPLTVIGAYVEMLEPGDVPRQDSDKIYNRLRANTKSALDMISRIRNAILNRTQASFLTIHDVSVDLSLKRTLELFETRLKDKKIKLVYNNSTEPESLVLAEENSLTEHIFANIISNAIKFSYEGSEIHINVSEENDYQNIEFRDFGTGIQVSRLEKRLLMSTPGTNGETGTGFGLMVMGYFLRKFGASIELKSEVEGPNKGTIVSVKLKKSYSYHQSMPMSSSQTETANLFS